MPPASLTDVPEESTDRAARAAESLLSLTDVQRARLLDGLSAFSPSNEFGLDRDEAADLARAADVDVKAVAAAVALMSYLESFKDDGETELRTRLAPDVAGRLGPLLREMSPALAKFPRRMELMARLARVVPTFRHLAVECELRQLSEDPAELELYPVALLRFDFDEGEGRVFQCTREALTRLIAKLQRAERNLGALETFAERHANIKDGA